MTEREMSEIEILLDQPEIIAWLELSEQQVVALLKLDESEDGFGRAPRAE